MRTRSFPTPTANWNNSLVSDGNFFPTSPQTRETEAIHLGGTVELEYYRLQEVTTTAIALGDRDNGHVKPPTAVGTGHPEEAKAPFSEITVAWDVTTGDDSGECYSNSGIQFYVRVKSASTAWSDWVYIWRSVIDPVQHLPPSISTPSLSQIPFGETTRFTAIAASAEAFDELEYRYFCHQQGGGDVEPAAAPLGPFNPAVLRRTVTWDVTTGDDSGECYSNSGIRFYVRVKSDSTAWSDEIYEWIAVTTEPGTTPPTTTTTIPPTTTTTTGGTPSDDHPTPILSDPSHASIPYTATTPFMMTVTSTREFTSWEYKYVCWDGDNDPYEPAPRNTWPASPASSLLSGTATWNIATGGGNNQCFSQPRANQVWVSVRIKSATTDWSEWAVHQLNIALAPRAPVFSNVSHDNTNEAVYGETVDVSAWVGHRESYTHIQQYVSCSNREGNLIDMRGPNNGMGTELASARWRIPIGMSPPATTPTSVITPPQRHCSPGCSQPPAGPGGHRSPLRLLLLSALPT